MNEAVLFFHLLGVLLLAGGIALAAAAFEAARRSERAAEIAALLGLGRVGALLVVSGGLLLLACGLWLVELEEIGFGTAWIDSAIALFALALLLGGLGGQRPKRARVLANRLAGEGEEASGELRALLEDPGSRLANYASAALVLVVLGLMVFKP